MDHVLLTAIGVGWIATAAGMAMLWRIQQTRGNAGIVDVGWTYAVGGLALWACISGSGWLPRRIALGAMMGLWSLRLGTYLLIDRVLHGEEDGRYRQLRASWGDRSAARFFWFFQAQALAAVFFALPAYLVSTHPHPSLHPLELMGLTVWLVGFTGETIADRQLERFKADRANRGRTCQVGLWHFSRHPNYFFEWTMWVAYAMFASVSPGGTVAWVCPLVMLYLLFKVTGIPATEAHAVRSRGDEYRRYQQTTSVFVPWWRRA